MKSLRPSVWDVEVTGDALSGLPTAMFDGRNRGGSPGIDERELVFAIPSLLLKPTYSPANRISKLIRLRGTTKCVQSSGMPLF
jgi:hypothetical protein